MRGLLNEFGVSMARIRDEVRSARIVLGYALWCVVEWWCPFLSSDAGVLGCQVDCFLCGTESSMLAFLGIFSELRGLLLVP